jgi:hypothetical protein
MDGDATRSTRRPDRLDEIEATARERNASFAEEVCMQQI